MVIKLKLIFIVRGCSYSRLVEINSGNLYCQTLMQMSYKGFEIAVAPRSTILQQALHGIKIEQQQKIREGRALANCNKKLHYCKSKEKGHVLLLRFGGKVTDFVQHYQSEILSSQLYFMTYRYTISLPHACSSLNGHSLPTTTRNLASWHHTSILPHCSPNG